MQRMQGNGTYLSSSPFVELLCIQVRHVNNSRKDKKIGTCVMQNFFTKCRTMKEELKSNVPLCVSFYIVNRFYKFRYISIWRRNVLSVRIWITDFDTIKIYKIYSMPYDIYPFSDVGYTL